MIKNTELRIGNLVKEEDSEPYQIVNGWQLDEGMELFPIPLTPDWLLRFGFEYTEGGAYGLGTSTQ